MCKILDNLQLGESKYITNSRSNGQNNLINVLKDCADIVAVKEMTKEKSQCTVAVLMDESVLVATGNVMINASRVRGLHLAKSDF